MTERIGILCGMEESFPAAFIEKINTTTEFRGEMATLGGIPEAWEPPYAVLVDRISHEVPYYRSPSRPPRSPAPTSSTTPSGGAPTTSSSGSPSPRKIGVRVPKTVLLPSKSYIPAIDPKRLAP